MGPGFVQQYHRRSHRCDAGIAGRYTPLDQVRQFERMLQLTDRHSRFWAAVGDGLAAGAGIDADRMRERAEHQQRRLLPLWRAAPGNAFPGAPDRVDTDRPFRLHVQRTGG